jgi:hypothetical protein
MSLDTNRHFEDAIQYKKSMRDPGRWLKLLRGGSTSRRLAETVVGLARAKAKSLGDALRETLVPGAGPRLSRDLRRLFHMKRPVERVRRGRRSRARDHHGRRAARRGRGPADRELLIETFPRPTTRSRS